MNVDVRLGSLADILQRNRDVCFAPESGHVQRTRPCPLRANSGHHRVRIPSEARLHFINRLLCCAAALPPFTSFLFPTETAWLMLVRST